MPKLKAVMSDFSVVQLLKTNNYLVTSCTLVPKDWKTGNDEIIKHIKIICDIYETWSKKTLIVWILNKDYYDVRQ